jgi:hypothetical protein
MKYANGPFDLIAVEVDCRYTKECYNGNIHGLPKRQPPAFNAVVLSIE